MNDAISVLGIEGALHGALVGLTLFIVSGVRAIFSTPDGKTRIDGKRAVLVVGTLVGIALSCARTAALGFTWSLSTVLMTVSWGALYAAGAFGYANYRQWVSSSVQPPSGPGEKGKGDPP